MCDKSAAMTSVPRRGAAHLAAMLALGAWLFSATAYAGKVEELSKTLREDTSYKVRVQAALLLGKLGDKAAAPALIAALSDENKMVRAIAAQSLGAIGAAAAGPALKKLLEKESDTFVRGQAEKALLALAASGTTKRARFYVSLGTFTGGVKAATADMAKIVSDKLREDISKLPSVAMELPAGVDEKSFARSGMTGFLIDGNISELEDVLQATPPESKCYVKVMIARWPSKSIISWTGGGASVQMGSRPQDRENARRECLEVTAESLAGDLAQFLKSQGG